MNVALDFITTTESLDILRFVYGKRTKDLSGSSFVPDGTAYVEPGWYAVLRAREMQMRSYNASDNHAAGVTTGQILGFVRLSNRTLLIPACQRHRRGIERQSHGHFGTPCVVTPFQIPSRFRISACS